MFWNVFRPGNFSQKWIFYDEKTEKLIFFLLDFQKSIFRVLKNYFQIFDSLKKNIESQNLKCLKTLKTYVLERFSSWKFFSKMDIL